MREVSLFRLYVLRALYLLLVVGLAIQDWPGVFDPARRWVLMDGQESSCMVAAFSVLCIFGLRYPLRMLPVLLWEIIWKTLWLASVLIPQWRSGHVDDALKPTVFACSWVVLVYIAVPWRYIYQHYVRAQGDRWRAAAVKGEPNSAFMQQRFGP
jgi:hypothetical protein